MHEWYKQMKMMQDKTTIYREKEAIKLRLNP